LTGIATLKFGLPKWLAGRDDSLFGPINCHPSSISVLEKAWVFLGLIGL
jgi:hypothetical protein